MFTFVLSQTHELVDATAVIAEVSERATLKFSPEMFSIMAISQPPSPRCIIALQFRAQFFQAYSCRQLLQYSSISFENFHFTLFYLQRRGFSKLIFSSTQPHSAYLIFNHRVSDVVPSREFRMTMSPTDAKMDIGEFDCTIFASIGSHEFRNVVNAFNNSYHYVLVTLTNSLVIFSNAIKEIILTTERRQCIIGGVSSRSQIQFQISLNPTISFHDLARRSERVWLHRSNRSFYGIIVAPVGLYSRFLAYIPERI